MSEAKIRNSISAGTAGINHTSVPDREREERGREGEKQRESNEGCAGALRTDTGPDTALCTVVPPHLEHQAALCHSFNFKMSPIMPFY